MITAMLLAAALSAPRAQAGPYKENGSLSLEHPELEQMRLDTGEAEKELADVEEAVNAGVLPKIEFDFDSDVIKAASYPTLDSIAKILIKNPREKLLITAHTCRI